jgi:cytochrome c556
MESDIVPATNKLWEIYQPDSERQWQQLKDAAIATITASETIEAMGDDQAGLLVSSVEFKEFNDAMKKAAKDVLLAISQRDVVALETATEALYPPCEGCHLKFNSGVLNNR